MARSSWPGHFRNLRLSQPELALRNRISDDCNAGSRLSLAMSGAAFWRSSEGCFLGNNCRSKAVSAWPSVLGWLALTSCLFLPVIALGQADTTNHPSPEKKSTSALATSSTRTAGMSSAKTRSTSHSAPSHPSSAAHSTARGKSNSVAGSLSAKGKRSRSKRVAHGQQKIDPQRAEEIQEALIRDHYLSGQPTGKWDQASEDALRRYQADHGWQSKTVPDSRALISLGLGPSHDHLLNPESAMTTGPEVSHSVDSSSPAPVSHGPQTAPVSTTPAPAADAPSSAQHDPSNQQK
jgi:hypothetical protein